MKKNTVRTILWKHCLGLASEARKSPSPVSRGRGKEVGMGQVELVKSRTIAEIAAIRETKLGNDLILDEFGEDFQEDSLAHSSSSPIPCNSYLQSHLRPSSLPACQSPLSLSTCPLPAFDDIAHFVLSGATLLQLSLTSLLLSSPSLTDSSFLLSGSKTASEQQRSKPETTPRSVLDSKEIDEKLHELLDICRPFASANIGKRAKDAETLLEEVTERLQYVKEERCLLKAKLLLGFLKEYRKEKGRNKASDVPNAEFEAYVYISPTSKPQRTGSTTPPKSFPKGRIFPTRTKTPLRTLRKREDK